MKLFSGIVYGYVKKNSSYSSNVESWVWFKEKKSFSKNLSFLPYAFNFYNYICEKGK